MDMYIKLQSEVICFYMDCFLCIIVFGGGVVGDFVGFVVVIFMCGIDFI